MKQTVLKKLKYINLYYSPECMEGSGFGNDREVAQDRRVHRD